MKTIFLALLFSLLIGTAYANEPLRENSFNRESETKLFTMNKYAHCYENLNASNDAKLSLMIDSKLPPSFSAIQTNMKKGADESYDQKRSWNKKAAYSLIGTGLIFGIIGVAQLPSDDGKSFLLIGSGALVVGLLIEY